MKPDKNSLSYRLMWPGADHARYLKSPAASDRLTQFSARRLRFYSVVVDECIAHSESHPGTPQQAAAHCYREILAVLGNGIGRATRQPARGSAQQPVTRSSGQHPWIREGQLLGDIAPGQPVKK